MNNFHIKNEISDHEHVLQKKWRVIINPFLALSFQKKDLAWGILGLLTSWLAFFVWGIMTKNKLIENAKNFPNEAGEKLSEVINEIIGNQGGGLLGLFNIEERIKQAIENYDFGSTIGEFGSSFPLAQDALILGGLSLFVLLSSIWLFATMTGGRKQSIVELITKLGSAQFFTGIVFLISAASTLVSLRLSMYVLLLACFIALIVTFMMAKDMFQIPYQRIIIFSVLSIAVYNAVVFSFIRMKLASYPNIPSLPELLQRMFGA
ncbi:hypothetical protein [Longirhabdus pacifica]|uniref:hypothetical protein n=1 Tax=Longirhabdus pacifica TaxID=2305227 RepID=UPI001008E79F|nr:hypothetical protein [Longirhabdus pacifica]